MRNPIKIFGVIAILFFIGCVNDSPNEEVDIINDSLIINDSSKISEEEVLSMISAIPNPVEISSLLRKSGVIYSSELLNPSGNISKYNNNFKRALNLGTYGTDLVHMNIYDKSITSMMYLKNVKDLASELKVEQFFDYATLNRLAQNSSNVDSMLLITSRGFDQMNQFLQESHRTNISLLIGFGTWIESMYLATNYQKAKNKKDVYNRVADQRFVIEMFITMLGRYDKDEKIKQILNEMILLKKEFDKIDTKVEEVAVTTIKTKDGQTVVQDNSSSTSTITDDIFKEITKSVKEIRNKVIY